MDPLLGHDPSLTLGYNNIINMDQGEDDGKENWR